MHARAAHFGVPDCHSWLSSPTSFPDKPLIVGVKIAKCAAVGHTRASPWRCTLQRLTEHNNDKGLFWWGPSNKAIVPGEALMSLKEKKSQEQARRVMVPQWRSVRRSNARSKVTVASKRSMKPLNRLAEQPWNQHVLEPRLENPTSRNENAASKSSNVTKPYPLPCITHASFTVPLQLQIGLKLLNYPIIEVQWCDEAAGCRSKLARTTKNVNHTKLGRKRATANSLCA